MIPNAVPNVGTDEAEAVRQAVETGMLAVGPAIAELEQAMARYLNGGTTVAVQSGTAALHLALLVRGVKPDDLVIVPESTFIATANAVRYCGAVPICHGRWPPV